MGSAKSDLLTFPEAAKEASGGSSAQPNLAESIRPVTLERRRPGVLEIVEDHAGNIFRAVYSNRFAEAVYVLHAFRKKSPKGIKTARRDVELVRSASPTPRSARPRFASRLRSTRFWSGGVSHRPKLRFGFGELRSSVSARVPTRHARVRGPRWLARGKMSKLQGRSWASAW